MCLCQQHAFENHSLGCLQAMCYAAYILLRAMLLIVCYVLRVGKSDGHVGYGVRRRREGWLSAFCSVYCVFHGSASLARFYVAEATCFCVTASWPVAAGCQL
jgi:hypothetical protein